MPSSGGAIYSRLPIEDSHLELLADILELLELPARGQFLQRYFRTTAHLDLRESQSLQLWEEALNTRRDLAERLGRPVSLKTALMDVLSSSALVRVPVLIEYDDLKRLQVNAVTDPLTGLYNRRLFGESLDKEITRARRYEHPMALVMLDLHSFKEVNDKHGHPKGDDVLRAVASTLKKSMRTSDSAFRIGGDEFALLLPQTDAGQALGLSGRVETAFNAEIQAMQLNVGVSMDHGVATYPQDGEDADALIRAADERLYQLKHASHSRAANGASKPVTPDPPEPPTASAPAKPGDERAAASPRTISIESKKPAEKTESRAAAGTKTPAAAAVAPSGSPASTGVSSVPELRPQVQSYLVKRKAERVSLAGTNAYALFGEQGGRRARVLNLAFGGVGLELDSPEELPQNMFAMLHVPILPPVRVNLRPVWSARAPEGRLRVGCCFVN
ncbi:MAG TPA: GGDEF domain-containing protein [Candidatus Acidoferrales bacterium]|nr:GGDEF domain-containing protein [Candidatus Acidoferrales bacterium]